MQYILVGVGGIFGSVTRYSLGKILKNNSKFKFPVGTFVINLTGALLLGLLSGLNINNNLYVLLGDGFLGSYTTFSTFMYEGFNLFKDNEKLNAVTYIVLSLVLGVMGYFAGFNIGKII